MNRFARLFLFPSLIGCAVVLPPVAQAQHRGNAEGGRVSLSNKRGERPGTRVERSSSARPGLSSARPGHAGTEKPNTQRPSGSSTGRHPGSGTCPGAVKPGNHGPSQRPGGGGGGSSVKPNRPGTSGTRPGGGTGLRPGHGGLHPGLRPSGTSAPRPGSGWASRPRPHYDYRVPGYRPPRPGGGYWGAPRPNPHRVVYRVPPVPRYVYVSTSVPSLGTILGLTFGSFIDAGINSLYNAGYTVSGYLSDAIYLRNVRQSGYLWPEAMVRYTDGLMSGTQFYSWSLTPDPSRYENLYRQLSLQYGMPVETSFSGGMNTSTWWAGGGSGYVTLQYGYGPSSTGVYAYYTSLTYSAI